MKPIPRHPLKFLWYIAIQYWKTGLLASVFVLLAQGVFSALPVVVKKITDSIIAVGDVTANSDVGPVIFWVSAYGIAYLLMECLWRGSGFSGMRWIPKCKARVFEVLFAYLPDHSEAYFRDRFAGSISNKIKNASRGVGQILETYLWGILEVITAITVSLVIAFSANFLIGMIFVVWITVLFPVNYLIVKYKKPFSLKQASTGSELSGQLVDAVTNMSSVRQYTRKKREQVRLGRYIETHRLANLKNWWISEWMLVMNGTLQSLILLGLLILSTVNWKNGLFTAGDVLMILNVGLGVQHALFWIGNQMNNLMDSYGELDEGLAQIIVPHEVTNIAGAKDLNLTSGKLEVRNVDFSYGKISVFKDLNFAIEPGQKVGIVGESGAGKSTLVQLLLRQYDVQKGGIYIDNQKISEVTQDSVRDAIAMVPQDTTLFHRSLMENIAYGKEKVDEEEVIQASKLAHAHEFIKELEEGYDTLVGERGIKLSGGQRQRIAIARAILKDSPILLLDEATSALDSESEEKIQLALTDLMKGKTVLAIAHRLSTIKSMDRILVFDQGKIVQDGSHEELLQVDGIYKKLWGKQVGGFIEG